MFNSWIKQAREAKQAAHAQAMRPQWTGEAWRDEGRPDFKAAFTMAVERYGVPYRLTTQR